MIEKVLMIEQVKKSKDEAKRKLSILCRKKFESTDDKKEIEEWVLKFIEFIESWKLEIRVYPKADIHAKVYIIRKDQVKKSWLFLKCNNMIIQIFQ